MIWMIFHFHSKPESIMAQEMKLVDYIEVLIVHTLSYRHTMNSRQYFWVGQLDLSQKRRG